MEEDIKTRDGGIRQLVELAISCGRSLQSSQTGYIHYCYHSLDDGENHTIPVYENILFALALLRSRASDNIFEARSILDRFLNFQSAEDGLSKGNFPIYLHEYPQCKDRFLGVLFLAPFYWILKQFHQVLGADLKHKLEKASLAMLQHSLRTHQEKQAPYNIAIRLAAGAKVFGELLGKPEFQTTGEALLDQLHKQEDRTAWCSPATIADILVALQMIYPSIADSPWNHLWKYLSETWHSPSCSYIGPVLKEYELGEEPQSTLYDLYMGYFSQNYSYRSFVVHPYQLQGILIQPANDRIAAPQYPFNADGSVGDRSWSLRQEADYAYSVIQRKGINPPTDKLFHPFKLVWGDRTRTHTFVCQGGNAQTMDYNAGSDGIDLVFTLADSVEVEDREKSREIAFYTDIEEGQKITLNGRGTTTFQLGDEVRLVSGGLSVDLVVNNAEGEGQYFGHIMRGNRPAQLQLKGEHRFDAYDWQFFLRTLRRSSPCKLKVKIKPQKLT